jgi:hypothetical protein
MRAASRIAVMLAGTAIACGGSPTQPAWDGQVSVSGTVLDFQTDAAIRGANVTIGGATATTNDSGVYSLKVQAGGERTVSIDGELVAIVEMRDRTYRGDFYAHIAGCVARYGTVVDKQSRRPVYGARVSAGGAAVGTDQTGWFRLPLGCSGAQCVGFNTTFLSITHPSYVDGSFVAGRGVCFVRRVDYELEHR